MAGFFTGSGWRAARALLGVWVLAGGPWMAAPGALPHAAAQTSGASPTATPTATPTSTSTSTTPAQPGLPSAEDFVRAPAVVQVAVSPSATRAAMVIATPDGRSAIATVELATPSERRFIVVYDKVDISGLVWVNDRRLVYTAARNSYVLFTGHAGTFAVDHNGDNPRQLVAWANDTSNTGAAVTSRVLPYGWFVWGTLDDDSDDILVYRLSVDGRQDVQTAGLSRLNTATGLLRNVSQGLPDHASQWVLDAAGQVRVVSVQRDGRAKLLWRAKGSDAWVTLLDEPEQLAPPLRPVALEGDDQLIVEARVGGDHTALFTYLLRERRLVPEPLAALKGYDIDAQLVRNKRSGEVLGLHTRAAQPLSVWFDERLTALQTAIDTALPGRSNRLLCGRCGEQSPQLLVWSASDRQGGDLLVFDQRKQSLARIAQSRPWLAESTQGTRSMHRVAARDGLMLPVVVTHPPGSRPDEPLPMVLLVHGGPWVRGSDRLWSAEPQFLASRGWRVLEVEYRGSTGFGWKHFHAGWKQWGLAMQDDLADAVAWAAQQKLADPARVCIVGASYGGYAALMGPIRHPGTYRCAASYAGVTDIALRFNATWSDLGDQNRRFTLPQLMGDPARDAAQFAATSPLQRVAEIKVPVLLAQGVHDRRVPPEHADRFMQAARAAGVQVERVDYDEGHTWVETRHHADFLRRLEAFVRAAFAR